ncbi:MAG: S8 family serine peptidase [Candidatus Hodarchaeales archaeon]|jgi:subtilisin family serine protease
MSVNQKFIVFLLILGITFGGLWISGISNHDDVLFVSDFSDNLPYGIRMIGADKAWYITSGSPEVVVAVLDTGLNTSHTDLQDILWTNEEEIPDNDIDDDLNGYIDDTNGWDFVHQNNDPFSLLDTPSASLRNHGTHVTGTIVAQMNDYGLVGVAPDVSIMPLRVVNENDRNMDIVVAEAIEYATANGADIISMSISISAEYGEITNSTSYQLVENALAQAYSQNVLIVAAAGNSNEAEPVQPANDSHVIAVGAITSEKDLATFSNHGAEVVAPGKDINSTIPNEGFSSSSGTSMATPHVSGALALLKSYNLNATNDELRDLLQVSAVDLGVLGYDGDFGYGLINVTKAMELLSGQTITIPVTTSSGSSEIASSSPTSSTTTLTTFPDSSMDDTSETTTTQSSTNFLSLSGSLTAIFLTVKISRRK